MFGNVEILGFSLCSSIFPIPSHQRTSLFSSPSSCHFISYSHSLIPCHPSPHSFSGKIVRLAHHVYIIIRLEMFVQGLQPQDKHDVYNCVKKNGPSRSGYKRKFLQEVHKSKLNAFQSIAMLRCLFRLIL